MELNFMELTENSELIESLRKKLEEIKDDKEKEELEKLILYLEKSEEIPTIKMNNEYRKVKELFHEYLNTENSERKEKIRKKINIKSFLLKRYYKNVFYLSDLSEKVKKASLTKLDNIIAIQEFVNGG